ncbi:MAG: transcription termination/antitermination protein NusG [Candidatus Babeliales bacterium]
MKWYVVQVSSGCEEKVKEDLEKRIPLSEFAPYVGSLLIPSMKMKKFFSGEEVQDEQLFPGYILVEMELVPGLVKEILSSPRAIRFLGGEQPVSLSQQEVKRIVSQMSGEVVVVKQDTVFSVGSEVLIKEGPFKNFVGIVDRIDNEHERATIMVSIFGRMTPVELGFHQIKREE